MEDKKERVDHHSARSVSLATLVISLGIVLVVGFIAGTRSDGLIASLNRTFGMSIRNGQTIDLDRTQQVYQMLKDQYDGEIDDEKLIDGASRGLTAGVGDPYTVYMNAKEATEYERDLSGSLSGIGAEIGVRSGQPTILRVLDKSPAQKAKLRAGDVIVKVGDESLRGSSAGDAADKIRGEAGTSVKLVVSRDKKPLEFSITRAEVSDPSVASRIDGTVGILTIRRFDMDTGKLARSEARKLRVQGAKSIILDLRDNGGGYLDQAQSVSGMWLDDKLVVTEKRGEVETERLMSTDESVLRGVETVILVNGGSASASEVVAGALSDNNIGKLVGEKTFGKGTVQQIFDLSDGRKLKVTVAHWYTPKGINIGKTGIKPDKEVDLSLKDADAGRDPQLGAALKILAQ